MERDLPAGNYVLTANTKLTATDTFPDLTIGDDVLSPWGTITLRVVSMVRSAKVIGGGGGASLKVHASTAFPIRGYLDHQVVLTLGVKTTGPTLVQLAVANQEYRVGLILREASLTAIGVDTLDV